MSHRDEMLALLDISPAPSPVQFVKAVDHITPRSLDKMLAVVGTRDPEVVDRFVPRSTLKRRRQEGVLSPVESGRVARFASVFTAARRVWGSPGAARDFLMRPHPLLEGETPFDLVTRSEFGAELVLDILGRLEAGTAA